MVEILKTIICGQGCQINEYNSGNIRGRSFEQGNACLFPKTIVHCRYEEVWKANTHQYQNLKINL